MDKQRSQEDIEAVRILTLASEAHQDLTRRFEAAGAQPPDMLIVAAMILHCLRRYGTVEALAFRVVLAAQRLEGVPIAPPTGQA